MASFLQSTLSFAGSPQDDASMLLDDVTKISTPPHQADSILDHTASTLIQEDPGIKSSQILFSEFVNIFVEHNSSSQMWEEISSYEKACAHQVSLLQTVIKRVPHHHSHFAKTKQMLLLIRAEQNLWRLLSSLFTEGVFDIREDQIVEDLVPQPTDKATIINLYETSFEVRLAQIVIDWLEKNALDMVELENFDHIGYFGTNHISWENTICKLKDQDTQNRSKSQENKVLEVDITLRKDGTLHPLDMDEDQRLIRTMFSSVRAGQVSDAQDLSGKSGQYWRASLLEGWKLHHDYNLEDPSYRKPIIGNQFRDVWKQVAWRAAGDKYLPKYERAMYGALCGHLESMKESCTNWEDLLWAHMRTFVDRRVEETLRESSSNLRDLEPLPKDYPEEKLTLENIFSLVECKLGSFNQENFYHVLQKFLVLQDFRSLVDSGHKWWNSGILTQHHLRCLTHLLLVLKRTDLIPHSHLHMMLDIFTSCVKETMERGDIDQVAWYCSILPEDLQVKLYVQFLINIGDEHQRKHALHLASLVGLNVFAIASTVVSTIRLNRPSESCNLHGVDVAADDQVRINCLDWLLFEVSHRPEVLRQANALMRSLLLDRKHASTKALFQKIPTDIVDSIIKINEAQAGNSELPTHLQNRVREYLCIKAYLEAQECFTDWFNHYHQKKPSIPPKLKTNAGISEQLQHTHSMQQYNSTFERWKQALEILSKKTCEHLYNVLLFPDGGWMVDSDTLIEDEDDANDSLWSLIGGKPNDMCQDEKGLLEYLDLSIVNKETNRRQQMFNLRSLYIPQVASLIQNILHYTKKYKECLQLSDLIASERHTLYKCFNPEELQRFIFKLQDSSKELLDMNLDALGYSIN